MAVVLDVSVAVAWCVEDERSSVGEGLLRRVAMEGALVPSIWHLETANAILIAVRRGRMRAGTQAAEMARLSALPIKIDRETQSRAWSDTFDFAQRFSLTAYDASYLELAHRTRLPLASFDRKLCEAASAVGVHVVGNG